MQIPADTTALTSSLPTAPPDSMGKGAANTNNNNNNTSSSNNNSPHPSQQPHPPQHQQPGSQHSVQMQQQGQQQICAACKKAIRERYLLKAMEQFWHEDCLKCSCCDCRLGEVGSTLFAKANLLLCRRDYLRLFGTTGYCAACNKMIPAFEMVMRARGNVYHLECFACQQCNHRFCVGDRFYLCENKILCEFDYEERMMFASMAGGSLGVGPGVAAGAGVGGGPGSGPPGFHYNSPGYNALSQMKRQTQSLSDDVSSGYGSPSPNSL